MTLGAITIRSGLNGDRISPRRKLLGEIFAVDFLLTNGLVLLGAGLG